MPVEQTTIRPVATFGDFFSVAKPASRQSLDYVVVNPPRPPQPVAHVINVGPVPKPVEQVIACWPAKPVATLPQGLIDTTSTIRTQTTQPLPDTSSNMAALPPSA